MIDEAAFRIAGYEGWDAIPEFGVVAFVDAVGVTTETGRAD